VKVSGPGQRRENAYPEEVEAVTVRHAQTTNRVLAATLDLGDRVKRAHLGHERELLGRDEGAQEAHLTPDCLDCLVHQWQGLRELVQVLT
jgi:hypothetical protein